MRPSEALALALTLNPEPRSVRSLHLTGPETPRNAWPIGSVLHGRATDSSDLDILIDPTPQATLFDVGPTLFDHLTGQVPTATEA